MKIISLKLYNIRSYTSETIVFPDGSLLLSGDIGSGKTTILLAIEFALFGIKRGDLSGVSLLRNGTNDGFVELTAEINEKKVIINRSLKRSKDSVKQDSGFLIMDERKIDATAVELKSRVLELLGYPSDIVSKGKDLVYRYTVFTPQEEMKKILTDDTNTRLDTLRNVFNIDKYKRTRENAVFIMRELKTKAKIINSKLVNYDVFKTEKDGLEENVGSSKERLERVNKELGEINDNIKQEEERLKSVEEKLELLNSLKNKLEVENNNINSLNQQKQAKDKNLEKINSEIGELNEKLAEFVLEKPTERDIKEIEESVERFMDDINEFNKKNLEVRKEHAHLKKQKFQLDEEVNMKLGKIPDISEKKKLLNEFEEVLKNKEDILREISETEEKLKIAVKGVSEYGLKIQQATELKDKITSMEKCPLCLREVNDEHKFSIKNSEENKITDAKFHLDKFQKEKTDLDEKHCVVKSKLDKIIECEKKCEVLKSGIMRIEEISKEVSDKQEILKDVNEKISGLENEINVLEKVNIDELNNKLEKDKKLLSVLRDYLQKELEKNNLINLLREKNGLKNSILGELTEINKNIEECNNKRDDLKRDIKNYGDVGEKVKKFKEKFSLIMKKEKELEISRAEILKESESVEKNIERLRIQLVELDKQKEELDYIMQLINWIDNFFVKLMDTIEKHVMVKIHREFNDLFMNWFNILMEDETINVRLDETFTPLVVQNGYETLVGDLSGGEKTSVALAYRLSLNKVINEFITTINTKSIIILDEPTDGFSTDQLDKVRDVLEELGMKQVVIVSHESKIESFVDSVIRVTKNEHNSRVLV